MRFSAPSTCLLIAGLLAAAPARPSVPGSSTERTLALLSTELMEAVERKDRKALENLVASDFALRMPGQGKVTHRAEWIANAIAMDWSGFRHERLVVRAEGDSATVSSKLRFRVAPIPFPLDSGVVDTWQRRDGRWQISGRYLGESDFQQRLAFGLGAIAALAAAGLAYAIARLVKRSRARAR